MLWFILLFLPGIIFGQWKQVTPFTPFQYFGFEHVSEANGVVVVFGPTYHTSIRLDGDTTNNGAGKHNGDSSIVAFVTDSIGPVNCDIPGDSNCQRHRAYTIQRFRGHKVEAFPDSTRYSGVLLKGPFFTQFWYKYSNLVLTCHHLPIDTGGCDWESPATWTPDTTDGGANVVTLVRDSAGYIHFEHTPTVDSSVTTYQLDRFGDPTVANRAAPGVWHLIQVYQDWDNANGYGIVWVDGVVHSRAKIHGRGGYLAQFHGGLYCSSAVKHGTVWNDNLLLIPAPDTNYVKAVYLATPVSR